ncbi:DsbA family protein [Streptomyces sp. HUAS MG91]|uniref:DsbA family protein n=1 Tax=Streptomyces tabacisoli TaxID=3156398 RepID=A0AAU8J1N3_9ACTN
MRAGEPDAAPRPVVDVTEFTDPACPWAWGSEPVFRRLRHGLAPRLRWRRVFGILFDEDDDPAPDPDAEARWYEEFIEGVAAHTRAPYAARLHWLTRTSWPASVVAKAAEAQGSQVADRVLRRLRETTFVLGRPADSLAAAEEAVRGVPGLDVRQLLDEQALFAAQEAVGADRAETRRPLAEVYGLQGPGPHPGRAKELADGHRYALPTLLFAGPGGRVCVPGWRPLREYVDAASTAAGAPLSLPAPLGPDAAAELWRSLTEPELRLLTGGSQPPADAVRVATGNGPLWLHPDEAKHHPATKAQAAGVSDNETPKGVH